MRTQKGFITIWMLTLLPLALVLLVLAGAMGFARIEYARKMHICRTGALEIQQDIAKATNQLLKLNPLAKHLRIQRRISDDAVRLGLQTVPYLGVGVQVHRVATIGAQYMLKARQDFIRFGTLTRINRKLWDIRKEIKKLHDNTVDQDILVVTTPLTLKLKKEPANSLTPDYNPLPQFEKIQAVTIRFYFNPSYYIDRIGLLNLKNKLLSQSTPPLHKKLEPHLWAQCGATLRKEEDEKWYPEIKKVRF